MKVIISQDRRWKEKRQQRWIAYETTGVGVKLDDVLYASPGKNPCAVNCATYPELIGIPIPLPSGIMDTYMRALEKVGEEWKP